MMQFIIKMQMERQGVSLHLVFTLLQHSQGRLISARDLCIQVSKSIFIWSTEINLRLRLYKNSSTRHCLAEKKKNLRCIDGHIQPVAIKQSFALLWWCEGFLKAQIPKLKTKSNYSATRKHRPVWHVHHWPVSVLTIAYHKRWFKHPLSFNLNKQQRQTLRNESFEKVLYQKCARQRKRWRGGLF